MIPGCETVSAFSGKGKMSALKLRKGHMRFRELFKLVGTDWAVSDELFSPSSRVHLFHVQIKFGNERCQ